MARNRKEEREALASFETWRRTRPAAGLVLGTVIVRADEGCCDVQFAHVDCCPVALVAAASELLSAAFEKLTAAPYADECRDLILSIERARVALDFEMPQAVQ